MNNKQILPNMKPTLLLIGASGRMGTAISNRLKNRFSILTFSRDEIDLSCPEKFEEILASVSFDLLVIPAALTAVDYCESNKQEAYLINAEAPQKLAEICDERGKKLVYYSTDFVFDGSGTSPYTEEDPTSPISIYAASKLEGENRVLSVSPDNVVVRLSWLFGSDKPAFPEWIITQAMAKDSLALPAEKISTPSFSDDIADYLGSLLDVENVNGVYNLCNSGSCSWLEWGQCCIDVAAEMGLPLKTRCIGACSMQSIEAFVAKRPVYSVLCNKKFALATGVTSRSWQEACRNYLMNCSTFKGVKETAHC